MGSADMPHRQYRLTPDDIAALRHGAVLDVADVEIFMDLDRLRAQPRRASIAVRQTPHGAAIRVGLLGDDDPRSGGLEAVREILGPGTVVRYGGALPGVAVEALWGGPGAAPVGDLAQRLASRGFAVHVHEREPIPANPFGNE